MSISFVSDCLQTAFRLSSSRPGFTWSTAASLRIFRCPTAFSQVILLLALLFALNLAHRALCAAAIFARDFTDIFRRRVGLPPR